MQFSTKIDGFEQEDSQGFENSYNSYEQYPLEKFFIFTIYQNYTLALKRKYQSVGKIEEKKRWVDIFKDIQIQNITQGRAKHHAC